MASPPDEPEFPAPSSAATLAMNFCCTGAFSTAVTVWHSREREFEAHGAVPGEEVEGVAVVEVDQVLEHIEYVFPREIGCGSCGNV